MFTIRKLDDEIVKKIETAIVHDYIEVSEAKNPTNKCVLISKYLNPYLEGIKNFKVFEDDVWVITQTKCGTTWTQEMVWLLNNNLNYDIALGKKLSDRFPYIELEGTKNSVGLNTLELCENLPRPRHIKSHLPAFLLPNDLWTVKPKIIYTVRNPKDVAVSLYHHYRNLLGYTGHKSVIFESFLQDKIVYAPFNRHVLEFWKRSKEHSNILFLFYEDMKRDLEREVVKTMKFLNKNYCAQEIGELCRHLSFESMKKNAACNFEPNVLPLEIKNQSEEKFEFIRKGKIGSHVEEMTENEIRKFDLFMNDAEMIKHGFAYKS